jgi:exopolyphosphatase/guanosine-5'-triphosphate,3'-diphosphate pyrophosphatase
MILAGIDIGTNTLRLLVADTGPSSIREIHSDRQITRLGEHLDKAGMLTPEARERSIAALADFARNIEAFGAAGVRAVGTSALRTAANSSEFREEVHKRTGLVVEVISGEEEARLTLLGVARCLFPAAATVKKIVPDDALVIDIGGGSTEIIMAGSPASEVSLPLGAVYLTERFLKQDPPGAEELERLRAYVRLILDSSRLPSPERAGILIGTAGTVTTLVAMDHQLDEYDPGKITGSKLTKDTISDLVLKLSMSRLDERRRMPGLEQGREDIILAGAVIVQEIMERFGFRSMLVSDGGLREGILLDLYDKLVTGLAP